MTAARRDMADLPYWPRLLSVDQAAAYVGVSGPTFTANCPVQAYKIGSRTLYDRQALDRWVDGMATGGKPVGFAAAIEAAHGGGDDAPQGH